MPWANRLDLIPCLGFMLDQQRLRSLSTIDNLADDDVDIAAALASMGLRNARTVGQVLVDAGLVERLLGR